MTIIAGILAYAFSSGDDVPILEAVAVQSTPGWLVVAIVLGAYLCLLTLAVWPDLSRTSEADRAVDHGNLER